MALATWWHDDPLPDLSPLPQFCACPSTDIQLIAHLTALPYQEIHARFQTGNRIYLAYMGKDAAAYGWVATRVGRAREIQLLFRLPPRNSYLWDFKTLPAWRGHGIYPHLLQEIIRREMHLTDRFWILYAPGNDISGRGIRKAGFHLVGDLSLSAGRASGIVLFEPGERAQTAATVFNLPIIRQK